MLSVTAICDQYAWLYQTTLPVPQGCWSYLFPIDGCYAAAKVVDGVTYLMFRGSTTLMDWIEDFEDCALPVNDPVLGDVHPGARAGLMLAKDMINKTVGKGPLVVVGHSLGAMHAALFAGYRAAEGTPAKCLVMFGEPRTGGPRLSQVILKDTMVSSYRNADGNGHDLVTDVARSLPPLLPYQHVQDPLTDICSPPHPLDPWLVFRYHHFALYSGYFGAAGPAVLELKKGMP